MPNATLVRTVGTTDTYQIPGLAYSGIGYSSTNSLRLSNGNVLHVVVDRNQSGTAGQGDNTGVTKIYVYERSTADVETLRATLTPGTSVAEVQCALFSNNDLAIVWNNGGVAGTPWNKVHYAKMTYAGYTFSAVETAVDWSADGDDPTFGNWKTKFIGVDVTDDGAVLLVHKRNVVVNGLAAPYNTLGTYVSVTVRTTGGTWVNTMLVQELSGVSLIFQSALTFETVSIAALGGTATARRFVWASSLRIDSWGSQSQLRVGRATVNTSTGAITANNVEVVANGWAAGYPLTYGHQATTKIWRKDSTSDSFVLGHANSTGFGVIRGTWTGAAFSFQQNLFMQQWTGQAFALGQDYVYANMFPGMSYALNKLVFYSLGQDVAGNVNDPAGPARGSFKVETTILHLDLLTTSSYLSGFEGKAFTTYANAYAVGCSGNRNFSVDSHEVLVQYGTGPGAAIYAIWQRVPAPGGGSGILNLSPATGSAVTSAQPDLSGQIDTDVSIDFTMYRLEYQFAENPTFTVGLIDWVEPVASIYYGSFSGSYLKEVSFTDQAGVTKSFSSQLPVSAGSLHAGVWYFRARLVNEVGQVGNWTGTATLTIGHPPTSIPLTPGGSRMFPYAAGSVDFTWSFSDPSPGDYQTAYQIVVTNEVTSTVILDTGKVTSTNRFHTATIAAGNKDQVLSWQLRTWDSDDANGNFSDKAQFFLTDPPVVTITAPTAGSTQATPRPNITFNVTTSGGRTVSEATVVLSQAGVTLWSQRVYLGAASGVSKTVRVPAGILNDSQSYSVQVSAMDSADLRGSSALVSFTADWVPPAAPSGVAVSVTPYNTEGQGYVQVSWTNATDDPNFVYYVIYRRDDQIDPLTGAVVLTGTPKVVYLQYATAATSTYNDYSAPSNYKVNYLVRQVSQVSGVEVESANNTYTSGLPVSDGYWLLQTDESGNTLDAFKLSIVTGESYTKEQEEQEFIIQGRGRVVNKGQISGRKGSLDAQLRGTGIYTARQKKQKIEDIAQVVGNLWLRNPFGDIFRVNVSGIGVTRLAGVGGSEFCDVSIPYAEVSE